ncbi:hypothetical protein C8R44DRAFT_890520 [Mycena epipterygia]|nr:hypothetical protein C8R44DRAFT_890520 [Mycena epipterygia]
MSVRVNGVSAPSTAYSAEATTLLSAEFAARFPPAAHSAFLITVDAGTFGLQSISIRCDIAADAPAAVVLGRDWTALFYDSLLGSGLRLPSTFDSWAFIRDPTGYLSASDHVLRFRAETGVSPPSTVTTSASDISSLSRIQILKL